MCLFVHMRTSSTTHQNHQFFFSAGSTVDSMECRDCLAIGIIRLSFPMEHRVKNDFLSLPEFVLFLMLLLLSLCFVLTMDACVTWESITYLFIGNFVFSLFHIIVIVDSILPLDCFVHVFGRRVSKIFSQFANTHTHTQTQQRLYFHNKNHC